MERKEAKKAGLLRYFSGKPCPRGHISERLVTSRECCECSTERAGKWNRNNRDRHLANKRKSRLATLGKVAARYRRWRLANAEKIKADMRRWQEANPDKMREYDKRRREKNPKAAVARLKRLTSTQAYRDAAKTNRRARLKGGGTKVTGTELDVIRRAAKGRCTNCGERRKLEFDHKMPLARGGSHTAKNIQMLCRPCNMKKRARDPIEWAQDNGRLL